LGLGKDEVEEEKKAKVAVEGDPTEGSVSRSASWRDSFNEYTNQETIK
jgi:hypothetical protein